MPNAALTVSRRPAQPSDDELLRTLFEQGRPEFALLPAEIAGPLLDMQVRAQHQHYATQYPNARHEILVVDEIAIGRLITDDGPDAVQVVDVALVEAHRGVGVGTMVLRAVIADAGRTGRPVRLSVWADNVAGHRLYARLGFVPEPDANHDGTGYLQLVRPVANPED